MKVTGIILAGGKSSRMGQDKALLNFQGKKLLAYSVALLRGVCSEILISTNQLGYDRFPYPLVADNYSDCGPLGGLEATLRQSTTAWNIIVSCDTPFLKPELFAELLKAREGFEAVIPIHDGGVEPLAALYHKNLADFFEQKILQSEFKLQQIIRERKVNFHDTISILNKYPRLFENLNTPNDLKH